MKMMMIMLLTLEDGFIKFVFMSVCKREEEEDRRGLFESDLFESDRSDLNPHSWSKPALRWSELLLGSTYRYPFARVYDDDKT
jgi:hypothetical protein